MLISQTKESTKMAYYQDVQSARRYATAVVHEDFSSFETLQRSSSWKNGASSWGQQHLYACRVFCYPPTDVLPFLSNRIRSGSEIRDPFIGRLIQGPSESNSVLRLMTEPQIVRAYGGIGYTWAALAPLLQSQDTECPTLTSERSIRERFQTAISGYVSSQEMQVGSSPTDRPNTASSGPSSLGFIEKSSIPLVEEFTLRFLSCFTRCVINYAQPGDKTLPYVQYRDRRLAYRSPATDDGMKGFEAIDDGGIDLTDSDGMFQIAFLETKSAFQDVINGEPTVSNELLAQLVGEALALRLSPISTLHDKDIIGIVGIRHYVKIFHLKITDPFLRQFRSLSPNEKSQDLSTLLPIGSTIWFDLSKQSGRKHYVRHIKALIDLADEVESAQAPPGSTDVSMAMD